MPSFVRSKIQKINNSEYTLEEIPEVILSIDENDQDLVNIRKELIEVARNYQVKQYPIERKEWLDTMGDLLWEQDYEVYISGPANNTATFIHWSYVNNANKKKDYESSRDIFYKLRFDKVNFKWTEYGEYTQYTLESKADSFIEGLDQE